MLSQDLRDSIRALRRTPAFTATAIVILALAIGANASIFALLNALTLRPLPYPHAEQLVSISTVFRSGSEAPLSFPMFVEFGRRQGILSSLIGWFGNVVLTVEADNDLAQGTIVGVTGNFFSELGVTPAVGRLFVPTDVDIDRFIAAPVAVLGYGFWQHRFGGDSRAIGQTVRVQGVPFTVVGIAPPGFKGFGLLAEPDVMVPLTTYPQLFRSGELNYATAGNVLWMKIAGRLRPGATVEQARAQLEALWPAIKAAVIPSTHAGAQRDNFLAMRLAVQSLVNGQESFLRRTFTQPLRFILGIALVVLLITSVNVASLMLRRVAGRAHELAVRTTLGASRWQASRRVLIEACSSR